MNINDVKIEALAVMAILIETARAATDLPINDLLGNVTSPIITTFGNYTLLGLGIAALLAFMAWRGALSLPAILFAAALVMGVLVAYSMIAQEVIIAALIIGGIFAGVGVGRWLGIL